MSVNVDLFGNQITPSEASPKKDAKTISTPPPTFDTSPTPDRVVSVETLGITPNYIATYETYLAGPNTNSIATADFNFQDRHHDCKMSQSAIKTIKKATSLICYVSRKESFNKERDRIINQKINNSGCTTKRFAAVKHSINKDFKKISSEARRNVSGGYNSKGEWIDGKHLCTFVTLTLPAEQRHTDRQLCSQLINPFFVWARKQKSVRYYIWKKELQANGNLHFHIIWDKAVNWRDIRNEWNKLCNKGYVKGIEHPFDYVDRYCAKWSQVHANGFNREYVREYVSTLATTEMEINEQMDAWEAQTGRQMTTPEYDRLQNEIIDGIVAEYEAAYEKELQKAKENKLYRLWTDPNSTDIRAVNSPRAVASYMSKYIAKEIENNPALANYQANIDQYKREMHEWQKVAEYNQKNDIDATDALECWQRNKDALDQYRRENCPIQGRMWFKSQSLTVFMKGIPKVDKDGKKTYSNGARQDIDDDYLAELIDLQNYLHQEEKRINIERAARAERAAARGDLELAAKLKEPISLVLERYDINPDGTPNTAKVICKTLLISVFDLQSMKTDTGRPRFPYLSLAWNRYMKDCFYYNFKRRLVDRRPEPSATFLALRDRATYTPDGVYTHVYSVYDMPFDYCKIESGNYLVTLPDADFYLVVSVPGDCARGKAIAAYLKQEIKAAIHSCKFPMDADQQRLHNYLFNKFSSNAKGD